MDRRTHSHMHSIGKLKVRIVIVVSVTLLLLVSVEYMSDSVVDASIASVSNSEVIQLADIEPNGLEIELVVSSDNEEIAASDLEEVQAVDSLDMSGEVHPLDKRGGSGGNFLKK